MSSGAALAVRGATVRFGSRAAIDDVDLDVADGEVLAVLGPSGSGKSTLLRAVAGLQPLDAGSVSLGGVDVTALPPHRRGIGMMFQHQALFPHLDVGRNVGFGPRLRGERSDVDAQVADLLDLVGLPGTEHRAVQTLSGGEQQRVALARTLAARPRAVLLDEPFGSLDRPRREQLVGDLRTLFDRIGLTAVAVTHDHAEAFALADRLAILDAGRLLQAGRAEDLWARPASARVATLLGFPNVGPARIDEGALQTPWGPVEAPTSSDDVRAVLVRAEGVVVDPGGPLEGRVVGSTFAGAHRRVVLAIAGAPPLELRVPGPSGPAVGGALRVRIEAEAVTALPA